MRRVYVGNYPYNATEQDIRQIFAPRRVVSVQLITDRESGRPRGFGFVELETDKTPPARSRSSTAWTWAAATSW